MKYTVEFFGVPHRLAKDRFVELELEGEVTIADIVHALRPAIPALEGKVICQNEDRLTSQYGININGRFHLDDYDTSVLAGDHIVIVTYALGG